MHKYRKNRPAHFDLLQSCYLCGSELISKQSTGLFTMLKTAARGEKQEVTS